MPVKTNFLERLILLRLNKGPGPYLDLMGAGGYKAASEAIEMGLFESLEEAKTPEELADETGYHERSLKILLEFLEALGYVKEKNKRYSNTKMTSKWMVESSEKDMSDWFAFWNELVFEFWNDHFEEVMRSGKPPKTIYEWFDEDEDGERWEIAQRGFEAAANIILDEVTRKIDLSGVENLLDVGGGHALYSLEFCKRYPELSATVFDNPRALDVARKNISGSESEERVSVKGGDYETDSLGSGYDAALVFNIIHGNSPEENIELFKKVSQAVEDNGKIVVLDQFEGSAPTPVGKTGLSFISLTYLVMLDARTYPVEDVSEWLKEAGFGNIKTKNLGRAYPGTTLLTAKK